MHRKMCIISIVLIILTGILPAQQTVVDSLTLEIAVIKAIENNPELQELIFEIKAFGAIKKQSGLNPNPEFEIEAENILGNNDFSGFRGSEITAKVNQKILLGRKISKSERIAEFDIVLAEWDYAALKLEIIRNVSSTFAKTLITGELIRKNKELKLIAEEFRENLEARVKAGKISPAEVFRAYVFQNSLQIELNKLEADYDSDIFELTSLIYDPSLEIKSLKGSIESSREIPLFDSLLILLENNPELKRFESEYGRQKAIIEYEESKSIPDLTVSAGYKRLNDAGVNTFLLGASIPLPIFDRNQGAISESLIRYDQKKSKYESVKNKLVLQLKILYNRITTLIVNADELKNVIIPQAEESFNIIKEGNLLGRFAILDVLDAERTLFELQNQHLNILGEINNLRTGIENLVGIEIK